MTDKYFDKFPIIRYGNTQVVDITKRVKVLDSVYTNLVNYYPYDIENDERADNISDRYYNDQYLSWILYLSNKIIDPYYEWYLNQNTMEEFLIKKYGSIANATNKIAFYRNNWYEHTDPVSVDFYDALDPALQKFYEPLLPQTDVYATIPIGYKRIRADWKISTNSIVKYEVTDGEFTNNEIVSVWFDSSHIGSGQVCASNSTAVFIQHVSGYTSDETITGASYIYGNESQCNSIFTSAEIIVNNIPVLENNYWSAVTYADIEAEQNETNKSIIVLDSNHVSSVSSQLKSILK